MRGPVVQSLNVRQNEPRLSGRAGQHVGRQVRIRERDPAEADEVAQPFADVVLRHVRQPFLQVAVGGTDEDHPRKVALQHARSPAICRAHAAQRILRRLVAVERRKQRRPLDVRVVVRAAGGDADPPDAEAFEHPQHVAGVVERRVELAVAGEHAEARHEGSRLRRTPARRPDPARLRYGTVSNTERRTTISRPGTSARIASITRRMKRVRSFERAAVPAGARARAQQLVAEIAVARLQVDERGIRRRAPAAPRRRNRRPARRARRLRTRGRRPGSADRGSDWRTPPSAPDGRRRLDARSGPSASAADRRSRSPSALAPNRSRCAATSSSRSAAIAPAVSARHHQLMRIRAAVVTHGDRLAAPDQLRAADAEIPPAPARQIARLALARAVPAFHRQDAEPVADANAVDLDRLRQRRRRRRGKLVVERQRDAAVLEMRAKRGRRLQRCDARIAQSVSSPAFAEKLSDKLATFDRVARAPYCTCLAT